MTIEIDFSWQNSFKMWVVISHIRKGMKQQCVYEFTDKMSDAELSYSSLWPPGGSINVMEQHLGFLGWTVFATCSSAHSKLRAESGDLSEDIGLLTLRVEGTA